MNTHGASRRVWLSVEFRSDQVWLPNQLGTSFPGSLDFGIVDKRLWSDIITVRNKSQALNTCRELGAVLRVTPRMFSLSLRNHTERQVLFIFSDKFRKLRLGQDKGPAQSHRASRWQRKD